MPASATASAGAPTRSELAEVRLEPDLEEEQHHADLGEQEDGVRQRHEAEHRRAEQDHRPELAENGRLAETLGQLAEELRPDEAAANATRKRREVAVRHGRRILRQRLGAACPPTHRVLSCAAPGAWGCSSVWESA